MTSSAQQALRRTMELYRSAQADDASAAVRLVVSCSHSDALVVSFSVRSNTTRFALACNVSLLTAPQAIEPSATDLSCFSVCVSCVQTSSKIIEPIQSRCAILRFTRLDDKDVLKRVKEVMDAERIVNYTPEGLEAILFTAQGDLRNALNNLQSTYAGLGAITPENVFKVVDQPHPIVSRTHRRSEMHCAVAEQPLTLLFLWSLAVFRPFKRSCRTVSLRTFTARCWIFVHCGIRATRRSTSWARCSVSLRRHRYRSERSCSSSKRSASRT